MVWGLYICLLAFCSGTLQGSLFSFYTAGTVAQPRASGSDLSPLCRVYLCFVVCGIQESPPTRSTWPPSLAHSACWLTHCLFFFFPSLPLSKLSGVCCVLLALCPRPASVCLKRGICLHITGPTGKTQRVEKRLSSESCRRQKNALCSLISTLNKF